MSLPQINKELSKNKEVSGSSESPDSIINKKTNTSKLEHCFTKFEKKKISSKSNGLPTIMENYANESENES